LQLDYINLWGCIFKKFFRQLFQKRYTVPPIKKVLNMVKFFILLIVGFIAGYMTQQSPLKDKKLFTVEYQDDCYITDGGGSDMRLISVKDLKGIIQN